MTGRFLDLRPYQAEAVESTERALETDQRPAIVLPTGGGKTVIFSHLAKRWVADRGPVTILVHRDELVRQAVDKLGKVAPGLDVGIVQGQVREIGHPVAVASVQTLARHFQLAVDLQYRRIPGTMDRHLTIVDECHHASAPSYRRVMEWLGAYTRPYDYGWSQALGVTATLARGDGSGLGGIWERVVFRRDILDLIPQYLVDVEGQQVTVNGLNLAEAKMSGGDFSAGSLSELMASAGAAELCARGYSDKARRPDGSVRPGIVFVPSVDTARTFATAFRSEGITAEVIWGDMDPGVRRSTLASAQEPGGPDVLINCMVLTEGFDCPRMEVAMIARPTASAPLYVQMVGRVLRQFPGKSKALVLDVVGATVEHRLAVLADLSSRRIRDVRPGESLAEAAVRERRSGNPFLAEYVMGSREVELFETSRATWLQTHEGVWFIGAGSDRIVFLWPDGPGTYRVGTRPLRRKGGEWLHEEVPLDTAMSWAQQEARRINDESETTANLVSRSASWRRSDASEIQLDLAARLGVKDPGVTKGQVSDRINVELASRALDPGLVKIRKAQQRAKQEGQGS